MPRQPRIFIPDVSVHVIHRGNNRGSIFEEQADYLMFLAILERAAIRHALAVHGYVLMTNHVHLLATPSTQVSLPRTIKELAARYARFYNQKYKRVGTLWNGRYRGILVSDELYWLTCLRYIEQNPVRAGMVASPDEYPWSSYSVHAFSKGASWLRPHYMYMRLGPNARTRERAYRELCAVTVSVTDAVPPESSKRDVGVRRVSDPDHVGRGVRHPSDPKA